MTRFQDSDDFLPRLTRREALRLGGIAGVAALLAACGQMTGKVSTPTSAPGNPAPVGPTTVPSATSSGTAQISAESTTASAEIKIPDTGAKLPTGNVTLNWVGSSQFTKNYLPEFFPAYHRAHPNITIHYDNLSDTDLASVLQLSFRNNKPPDVFRLLSSVIPSAQAVKQGLVAPIDDIVPNFKQWKAAFPPASFLPGINEFNGKTYSFPMLGNFMRIVLYNAKYLQQAGYDPSSKPLTWDEYRAAAKKITQQGKGKYYGAVFDAKPSDRLGGVVDYLAEVGGAPGGSFNYKTGEYNYTSDAYVAAIDLIMGLKSDGSIFPGSISLNADEARSKLPQGVAAMAVQETGVTRSWIDQYPDFDWNVSYLPVPKGGAKYPHTSGPSGTFFWFSAKSEQPEVVGDIFSIFGSEEGQATWQRVSGGVLPAVYPKANQQSSIDKRIRSAYALYDEHIRIGPSPEVRNQDVAQVQLEMKPIQPDIGDVAVGIFTGQIKDVKQALKDLNDRSEQALEEAISAAKKKGAKVSRDDWKFPNWDPTKNYTSEDYKQLS